MLLRAKLMMANATSERVVKDNMNPSVWRKLCFANVEQVLGFQGVKLQLWESKVSDFQCNPREVGRRGVFCSSPSCLYGRSWVPVAMMCSCVT